MSKLVTVIACALAAFFAFGATSFAAGAAASSDASVWDLARSAYDAVAHGQYAFAAATALVLAVAAARKYGAPRWPWLRSDAGAISMTLFGALGGAFATAVAAGTAPSWGLAWIAVKIAFGAAGGYAAVKKLLIDPIVKPHVDEAPIWLRPILKVLVWAFDHAPAANPTVRARVVDHR